MCNNTLRLGPQEGLAVVRWLFNNVLRGDGAPVQGEASGWLVSCTVAAAASPLRVSPQQPCSMPLPVGDVSRGQAVEAETGEAKLVLLVLFLDKANWHFQEALRLVSLKSGARCSWLCSQLGSLAASFQILYFCEKPDACNSFISASSDAAHMGAADTSRAVAAPCCTPSRLLCLPSVVSVMVILGWWQSCKNPDRECVPKPTTIIHLLPRHDPRQQGEIIAMKSLSCNPVWVQLSIFKPCVAYCHVRV